jgi:hypothetical protein
MELAADEVDPRLRQIALRTHDRTAFLPQRDKTSADTSWRLDLPAPKEELQEAALEL